MSNPDEAVVLYTAETDTTGGRDGASRSSDDRSFDCPQHRHHAQHLAIMSLGFLIEARVGSVNWQEAKVCAAVERIAVFADAARHGHLYRTQPHSFRRRNVCLRPIA